MAVSLSALVERLWRALGWLWVALLCVGSVAPSVPLPMGDGGDKFWHAAAYAGLMWWWAQLYGAPPARRRAAAALVALGVLLEGVQGLTAWRQPDAWDAAANALGVVCGALVARGRAGRVLAALRAWLQGTDQR
ncbi:MAG: hypothetical protein KatS3mg121_0976 [Gammaproteobacteria bacterium]|nr:MAG: hypothetical protein KatS3mg121_0976 [Gammaproteobacteria bacterium]